VQVDNVIQRCGVRIKRKKYLKIFFLKQGHLKNLKNLLRPLFRHLFMHANRTPIIPFKKKQIFKKLLLTCDCDCCLDGGKFGAGEGL
jgi:hypothetical protein